MLGDGAAEAEWLFCEGERSKRILIFASVSVPASKVQSQDRSFGFDSGPRALGAAFIFFRFSKFCEFIKCVRGLRWICCGRIVANSVKCTDVVMGHNMYNCF